MSSVEPAIVNDWHTIPNARDRLKWYENKGQLKLDFFLGIIFLGMILNGYDGILISGLQASEAWQEDLNYPSGARLGLLNAIGYISGFLVGPIIAHIDEKYGRRWGIRFYGYTMLLGSIIGCIAGVSGANGYGVFLAGRAVIGLGLASFLMTSLIVVQEITHPRTRAIVAQSWNSYYILGSVLASWVNFGCIGYIPSTTSWSWRIPYILQVPFALTILIAVQFVPETPRWLLSKGREEEALQFLIDYHGNGDSTDELVRFEFEEMKQTIKAEQEAKGEKWSVILRSRANRKRLALAALTTFLTNMSGSSIIYYYYTTVFELVGITSATVQTGISAGLSMFTWFCQLGAVYVGTFVGRKTIILWVWPCILLSLVGLTVSTAMFAQADDGDTHAGIATVALVWIFLGVFNFSNPVLFSYPAEIQTFSMRSKGMLIWNGVTQIEYAYVTFVDGIALDAIGYKYYIVYIPLVVIQWVLAYFFMVETKGYTLEEIAIAFEGQGAAVNYPDFLPSIVRSGTGSDTVEDVDTKA